MGCAMSATQLVGVRFRVLLRAVFPNTEVKHVHPQKMTIAIRWPTIELYFLLSLIRILFKGSNLGSLSRKKQHL